jgi:3-dehydroquinate dehydratase
MKIPMLHGINHNMFGKRDPAQCGYLLALRVGVSAATSTKAACA